jgi:hypothetical protein
MELIEIKDRPVATQLRTSILDYMHGGSFRPTLELDTAFLQSLIRKP